MLLRTSSTLIDSVAYTSPHPPPHPHMHTHTYMTYIAIKLMTYLIPIHFQPGNYQIYDGGTGIKMSHQASHYRNNGADTTLPPHQQTCYRWLTRLRTPQKLCIAKITSRYNLNPPNKPATGHTCWTLRCGKM